MAYDLKLADLAAMNEVEAAQAIADFEAAVEGPRNGRWAILAARIRELEQRYEMTSAEMIRRLESGEVRETAEIAQWLYLLDARDARVRT